MSRHHPYSGYDDSPPQNGGHRKFGFGNHRGGFRGGSFGNLGSRRGGGSHNGFGNPSKAEWESSTTGPDRSFSDHGSSERELPHFPRSGHKALKSRGVRGKLRGGFPKVHAERELSIDERIQRERPCRTLFVRNVKYETNSEEVREKFEQMGEIKIFFDLISTRGMAFITYYDLRAATIAKEKLQGTIVSGRPIDVHYSLPKDNELERRCDREKNQATLFLAVNGANNPIDDEQLKVKFEAYGEIRSIKQFKDSAYQRFVEFWDSRACEQAHDDLVGSHYLGGKLDLKFSWDTGMVPKARLSKERRGHDDGNNEYSYNYEQFEDQDYYDQEERGDYGHDHHTTGGHNAYEEDGDHYGSHGAGQSYFNNPTNTTTTTSRPSSNANHVDLGRLDQAQKVQELLASLTKPAVGTAPTASLPLSANPLGKYSNEAPASTQTSQPSFMHSNMVPMQLPANFTPNYPTYPVAQPSEMPGLAAPQANPASNNSFKDLAQIIGQLRNPSSAAHPPMNEHGAILPISYTPPNDAQKHPATSLGSNHILSNAQPTLALPPSVLDLLRQHGGTPAPTHPNSLPQNKPYQSNPSAPTSIPTAPRAMQAAANIDTNNYLPTQPPTHLLNSMARPLTPAPPTAPLALVLGSAKQAPVVDDYSVARPLNQINLSPVPPVGTANPNTNAAVQQLLALLQQQQQRPDSRQR